MPDIEIVIKMSEEEYSKIKENDMGFYNGRFFQMVRNGTVLPKGHGALIDVNEVAGKVHGVKSIRAFLEATVIIPADKEKKDAHSD